MMTMMILALSFFLAEAPRCQLERAFRSKAWPAGRFSRLQRSIGERCFGEPRPRRSGSGWPWLPVPEGAASHLPRSFEPSASLQVSLKTHDEARVRALTALPLLTGSMPRWSSVERLRCCKTSSNTTRSRVGPESRDATLPPFSASCPLAS